jgi:uncharacterized membrane protein YfcA
MWHNYLLIFSLVGIFSGIVGGLLGLGGGVIIIPVLTTLFPLIGIDNDLSMHVAIGTSLATTIIITSVSTLAHYRRLNAKILFRSAIKLWPGIVTGTTIGILIAAYLSTQHLSLAFGVMVILIAMLLLIKGNSGKADQEDITYIQSQLPRIWLLTLLSFMVGVSCSLLGVGGFLIVPILQQFKVPMRYAVAISSSCVLLVAIAGTIGYIVIGYGKTAHLTSSVGYIYLPAFIPIAIFSMMCTTLGVKLAHRFPAKTLRLFFLTYLLVVAVKMIIF